MVTNEVNPFSPSDLSKINKILQSCADTHCLLDKLEAMGLDVSELRNGNESHRSFATAAKKHFFPMES